MMVVVFTYLAWILYNPLHLLLGETLGRVPSLPILLFDTVLYIPIINHLLRKWLGIMTKRKKGPAAGIDVVEPTGALPEEGDEIGTAIRKYRSTRPPKIPGSKSDIRDTPFLEKGFFVKPPNLDSGEPIFDSIALKSRALIRSKVSTGGWIRKRISSRGSGSLKATESSQHGRPLRSRIPDKDVSSIHLPATIVAAIKRIGRIKHGERIQIQASDIREKVYTARMPLTIILVIDVSLSMRASMNDVRKLVERIERETRGSRDRIGIIAFKDSGAIEVQGPTSNWNKVYRALAKLRVSGLTPLADGLMKAIESIKRERMRNPHIESLVVVISDFSPNIPLAQDAGPGSARYTPVRDLVRAARLVRKAKIRLVAINVDPIQKRWTRILKRPYHEAIELATLLRMKKEGHHSPVETILTIPAFRKSFGAFLVAHLTGGKAFLTGEILNSSSVIGTFLAACQTRSRLHAEQLREAEEYIHR